MVCSILINLDGQLIQIYSCKRVKKKKKKETGWLNLYSSVETFGLPCCIFRGFKILLYCSTKDLWESDAFQSQEMPYQLLQLKIGKPQIGFMPLSQHDANWVLRFHVQNLTLISQSIFLNWPFQLRYWLTVFMKVMSTDTNKQNVTNIMSAI